MNKLKPITRGILGISVIVASIWIAFGFGSLFFKESDFWDWVEFPAIATGILVIALGIYVGIEIMDGDL